MIKDRWVLIAPIKTDGATKSYAAALLLLNQMYWWDGCVRYGVGSRIQKEIYDQVSARTLRLYQPEAMERSALPEEDGMPPEIAIPGGASGVGEEATAETATDTSFPFRAALAQPAGAAVVPSAKGEAGDEIDVAAIKRSILAEGTGQDAQGAVPGGAPAEAKPAVTPEGKPSGGSGKSSRRNRIPSVQVPLCPCANEAYVFQEIPRNGVNDTCPFSTSVRAFNVAQWRQG